MGVIVTYNQSKLLLARLSDGVSYCNYIREVLVRVCKHL